jgi:hypothetical protein
MKKYFAIILAIAGCKKHINTKDETLIYTAPSCADNPLFCDDEEFDDLPEHDDSEDTGD